jgi:response regulator RpfG family c-di-GMP phosphodiesterase
MSENLPRILCVDDEPNLLAALERSLGEHYAVTTAVGGAPGLEALQTHGPFDVVISDMRMPEMDGATFLTQVRERWPNTMRILLTGQADTQSAIAAINGGEIFRYLCKPCSQETLMSTLQQAVHLHSTAEAERKLMETTLSATVKVLTEVLSLCAPWAFRRASFARSCVRHALKKLQWQESWMYEIAAGLSQIGGIVIPEDTVRREAAQRPLKAAEAKLIAEHPETAYRMLKEIPRLERVAEMIRYQCIGPPPDVLPEVARGAELLRAVLLLSKDAMRGVLVSHASNTLRNASPPIAPAIMAALADFNDDPGQMHAAMIFELQPGWVLGEDVSTIKSRLLLSKGHELTDVTIVALRRLLAGRLILEPIYVHRPADKPLASLH